MKRGVRCIGIVGLLCGFLAGQQRRADPAFEVASIRRTAADNRENLIFGCRGGPGTRTPARWTCHGVTVPILIGSAYRLKRYQMAGDFLSAGNNGPQFDIEATLPAGATEEEFRQMQIDLLKTRFALMLHFEEKQASGLVLTVRKSKLQAARPPAVTEEAAPEMPGPPIMDRDGFPTLPHSTRPALVMMGGRARWTANDSPIDALVELLEHQMRQPVTDETKLHGRYDFTLKWSTAAGRLESNEPDDAPSLTVAVQEQLGLALASKQVTIAVPVIDRIEKTPTAN